MLARDAGIVTGRLASWGRVCDKLSVDTAPPVSIPASGGQSGNLSSGHTLPVSSFKASKPLQIPQTTDSLGPVPIGPWQAQPRCRDTFKIKVTVRQGERPSDAADL